jgi:hypothetical protein
MTGSRRSRRLRSGVLLLLRNAVEPLFYTANCMPGRLRYLLLRCDGTRPEPVFTAVTCRLSERGEGRMRTALTPREPRRRRISTLAGLRVYHISVFDPVYDGSLPVDSAPTWRVYDPQRDGWHDRPYLHGKGVMN